VPLDAAHVAAGIILLAKTGGKGSYCTRAGGDACELPGVNPSDPPRLSR
jgi:hypothetical protein